MARDGAGVVLSAEAVAAVERSRAAVEKLAEAPTPAYGISTGFGALATRHIPTELRAQLQRSLVRSHAAGSGPEVEREVTRALMLLRLSTLATGHTGVRLSTVQTLAGMLSHGVTPVVHEYGSLGCSGDLAPLSHCALALMGEGEVTDAAGVRRPAAVALNEAGLEPVELAAKEGLALINGTDGMLGMLVMADRRPADAAQVRRRHRRDGGRGPARHRPGLRRGPAGPAAAPGPGRLRRQPAPGPGRTRASSPAIAGRTATGSRTPTRCAAARRCTARPATPSSTRPPSPSRELASAVDNPVVLDDGRVESNGNFHGAPVGYVLDFLAIVAADVASMSERRTDRFLDKVPQPRAAPVPGRRPGRRLRPHDRPVHPGGRRLGAEAARRARQRRLDPEQRDAGGPRLDGLVRCPQAAPLRRRADPRGRDRVPDGRPRARHARPAAALAGHRGRGLALLRRNVEGPGPDRHLAPEIEHAVEDVRSGALVGVVEHTIGELA